MGRRFVALCRLRHVQEEGVHCALDIISVYDTYVDLTRKIKKNKFKYPPQVLHYKNEPQSGKDN